MPERIHIELSERLLAQTLNVAMNADIPLEKVRVLRKSAMTLHRQIQLMAEPTRSRRLKNHTIQIVRNDDGQYFKRLVGEGRDDLIPAPDLITPALFRIATVCRQEALHYYYCTDPQQWTIYVAREELNQENFLEKGLPVFATSE